MGSFILRLMGRRRRPPLLRQLEALPTDLRSVGRIRIIQHYSNPQKMTNYNYPIAGKQMHRPIALKIIGFLRFWFHSKALFKGFQMTLKSSKSVDFKCNWLVHLLSG